MIKNVKKSIVILVTGVLIFLMYPAVLLTCRYAEDKKYFDLAKEQATQFMRLKNYDNAVALCTSKYNPLTRTYYVYFGGEKETRTVWSIDMTSMNDSGIFEGTKVEW